MRRKTEKEEERPIPNFPNHIAFRFVMPPALICRYCRGAFRPEFPIELNEFIKLGNEFAAKHVDCKPPYNE